MAKLVIIDDLLDGSKLIQKQFESINSSFSSENTFVFVNYSEDDNMKLVNINSADNDIVFFKGHKDSVRKQLIEFIVNNENEPILIVIDTLLISQSPNQPSIGKYYTDGEYSDEIYKYLYELKNGKDIEKGYNLENVCFFMSFRSESSISIISQALKKKVKEDEEELKNSDENKEESGKNKKIYFPREACEPENISWVLNACQSYDKEHEVNTQFPLIFPDKYIEFFKSKEFSSKTKEEKQ